MKMDQIQKILRLHDMDNTFWMMATGAEIDLTGEIEKLESLGLTESAVHFLLGQYETFTNLGLAEPPEVISEEYLEPAPRVRIGVARFVPRERRRQFDEALRKIRLFGCIGFSPRRQSDLEAEILVVDPAFAAEEAPAWIDKVVVTPMPYDNPGALQEAIADALKGLFLLPPTSAP